VSEERVGGGYGETWGWAYFERLWVGLSAQAALLLWGVYGTEVSRVTDCTQIQHPGIRSERANLQLVNERPKTHSVESLLLCRTVKCYIFKIDVLLIYLHIKIGA
jgi:hypothetical protein